jgi:hypothetical protein
VLLMADETSIPGGFIYAPPGGLQSALTLDPEARVPWKVISPLARNEWIC